MKKESHFRYLLYPVIVASVILFHTIYISSLSSVVFFRIKTAKIEAIGK